MAGSFQKDSLGWQFQQWRQQMSEGFERLLYGIRPPNPEGVPSWIPPDWVLQLLFWLIVLTVLGWAGWQLFRILEPWLNREKELTVERAADDLAAPTLTAAQWVARSRQAAQQGDYKAACRALYLAMLQKLHESDRLPHDPSRTDGEVLQALPKGPQAKPLSFLVQVHDRLWFGQVPPSKQIYDRCQRAYQEAETP